MKPSALVVKKRVRPLYASEHGMRLFRRWFLIAENGTSSKDLMKPKKDPLANPGIEMSVKNAW